MLIGLLNCFFFFSVAAQEISVTGTITDTETGEPLIGVNILDQGAGSGTVTDLDGNYTIKVVSNGTLVFSYIGYVSQTVAVEGKTKINISLDPDVAALEELVVVGYGVMKRSDLTGAVSSVGDVEIAKVKSHNAVEALQAKVSGMDLKSSDGRAGSNPSVSVRGSRSLSGSNSPLYIVDGVDFGSSININANDIASMEVLKDASSTAIYGSRGANGVIIITTKKGSKGKAQVTLSSYYGITTPLGELPVGDSEYYLQMKRDLLRTSKTSSGETGWWDMSDEDVNTEILSSLYPEEQVGMTNGTNFIWPEEEMEDHGTQQSYHINIAGGDEKTTYSTSLEHFVEDTYIEKDKYERFGFRTSLDSKVNDILRIGNSTVLTFEKLYRGEGLDYGSSPLVTPYDADGNLVPFPVASLPFENPYIDMDPQYKFNETFTTRAFSNFYGNIQLAKGLSVRSNINADLNFKRVGNSTDTFEGLDRANSASVVTSSNYKWTWTNVLTYDKTFNENHHIMLTAATEAMANRYEYNGGNGTQLDLDHDYTEYGNWYNLGRATGDRGLTGGIVERQMMSYIGRIHYGYKGKYLAQLSFRDDGASQLAEGNQWSFFPSGSVAWRVSEENFMKNISHVVSNLKLRLGAGVTGNQSISPYSSFGGTATYSTYYDFGDTGYSGTRTGLISNPNLTWEETTNYNIGIDFGLFNGRIGGSIELYRAETDKILQEVSLPPTSAIPYVSDNIGETLNQGIEITMNTMNVKTRNFTWTTDFTFTKNDEEITFLSEGVTQNIGNRWFVGQPLSVFYDYKWIGIWQTDEAEAAAVYGAEPGDIKFEDIDNDGDVDEDDRTIIGTNRPKWYGGITSNMSYKNWDLSILLYARYGHTIRDGVMTAWSPEGRQNSMQLNYWTPKNPTNDYPRVDPTKTRSGWSQQSALAYTDGSYWKIKDITLGYTLPEELTKKAFISSARIYGSVKNAFVFSKYFDKDRYDPESEGSISFPAAQAFIVGASVTF